MRIVHLRTRDPRTGQISAKGGVTVAYEQIGNTLLFATSRCNPRETFNRRIGRTAATGKLKKYLSHPAPKYKAKLQSLVLMGDRKPIETLAAYLGS